MTPVAGLITNAEGRNFGWSIGPHPACGCGYSTLPGLSAILPKFSEFREEEAEAAAAAFARGRFQRPSGTQEPWGSEVARGGGTVRAGLRRQGCPARNTPTGDASSTRGTQDPPLRQGQAKAVAAAADSSLQKNKKKQVETVLNNPFLAQNQTQIKSFLPPTCGRIPFNAALYPHIWR